MPFTPSRWTVIKGDWTQAIYVLLKSLLPFQKLTTWTTAMLIAEWRKSPNMVGYTAHSIKRGAVTHLFRKADEGEQFPVVLISRLAKHKAPEQIADTTLRYGGDPVAMARLLATATVTSLL
ncbi:hypothetical protein DIPPA_23747 [Diplonema papillatum]|nr:hypothetical protein DIPPA_00972 [Diplonema papillatum]KAJ9438898.1 hypothetical protein DIPPA_01726 [Diplonema papillatum]KAJ9440297.1 hypothetical protein DIPPA_30863 [Diplonema papillatum]KAJ9443130.1 hypothetical protein DIPPA_11333 [Diplonema papillatum]KAJ9443947.1 hypothetical protein DIPPA_27516 [Diplonema papillatum]